MDFFTQDDLEVAISAALMTPNFKTIDCKFDKVYNFGNTKMGSHWHITVIIEFPDNTRHSLSLFSKFIPDIEEYKNFARTNDCFGKEALFYSHIASIMTTLLPSDFPLPIPQCYFARGGSLESESSEPCPSFEASAIILQDLYPLRYFPMDMWTPLDLQHCRIVLRALAIFHGGSILLQQSKVESAEIEEAILSIKESVFVSDGDSISNKILHAYTETTAAIICQIWPDKYPREKLYGKLLDVIWNSWENVFSLLHPESKYVSVICHGELCGNNILFAYDKEHRGVQKPVDVKFVDMQLLRYAPPVTDILMFLYVCTSCKFRSEHLSELIYYYYSEFSRVVSPKVAHKTLSLEALETSVQDMKEFGLMAAVYLLPICLASRPTRSSGSFHFSDITLGNVRSPSESRSSTRRFSSDDAGQFHQDSAYPLLKNQAPRILGTMKDNQFFKNRLLEAYEEYLKFVGLWERPTTSRPSNLKSRNSTS